MRLFSYADKYGSARTGVLTDDGLVSGNQLERHLRIPLLTLGDPGTIALDGLGQDELARAAKRARKAGAKLRNPATRYPLPAVFAPEKIIGIGLNYADHAKESRTASPSCSRRAPPSSISRWSSAWSSAGARAGSRRRTPWATWPGTLS